MQGDGDSDGFGLLRSPSFRFFSPKEWYTSSSTSVVALVEQKKKKRSFNAFYEGTFSAPSTTLFLNQLATHAELVGI